MAHIFQPPSLRSESLSALVFFVPVCVCVCCVCRKCYVFAMTVLNYLALRLHVAVGHNIYYESNVTQATVSAFHFNS